MSKIGVGVGEEFPVQDSNGSPSDAAGESQAAREENRTARDHSSEAASGRCRQGRSKAQGQSESAHWKWRREGQRHCEDVRNEGAEWEAQKRAFKEKIRTAVHDAVRAKQNGRHDAWRHSWRSLWPSVAGIGIAALAFAIHRHSHRHRAGGCRYYDDSDIRTPPHRSPPNDGGPIITPPPSREH